MTVGNLRQLQASKAKERRRNQQYERLKAQLDVLLAIGAFAIPPCADGAIPRSRSSRDHPIHDRHVRDLVDE
ncbi:hypothetical protein RND71_024053 [Anisodus tanguticus]|uniref:Uncharacterized protein n=1 Tax=Anisodus tanguticus TaxID=243964 RepID=A0AAE1RQD5_9SOLA|nr:hypothetical protein RND71_024053 [Anisodus tanguticus]